MTPDGILVSIAVVPVVVLMFLRANAAIVFMSLCLGDVLVQFVSPDANQFFTLFSAHVAKGVDTGSLTIKIFLLVLPVVLTTIFMMRTVKGKSKQLLNLLPALGVGLLGALLVTPLLPAHLSDQIISSSVWNQLEKSEDLIVGLSSLASLVVLWLQRPKTSGEKESKHKN